MCEQRAFHPVKYLVQHILFHKCVPNREKYNFITMENRLNTNAVPDRFYVQCMNEAGCNITAVKAKLCEIKGSDDKRKRLYHTVCTFNPLSLCLWLHFPFPFFTPTTLHSITIMAERVVNRQNRQIACKPENPYDTLINEAINLDNSDMEDPYGQKNHSLLGDV